MNRVLKAGGLVILLLGFVLITVISLTVGWRPFIGPKARTLTNRTFERTPERLARGQYLVENLGCFDCHGEHDWTRHDAPLIEGTRGAGLPQAGTRTKTAHTAEDTPTPPAQRGVSGGALRIWLGLGL